MLELQGVQKTIFEQRLFHIEQLRLSTQSIYGVVGEIGCGKSTLLRVIAGLEKIDSGKIVWNEQEWSGRYTHLPANRRRVGMVFQDHALWPHMSVEQHLRFAFHNRSTTNRTAHLAHWEQISRSFTLDSLYPRYPAQLSGGQKQRLGLARALCQHPQILLIDEGFNQQDLKHREQAWDCVHNYQQSSHCLLICVSHYAVELDGQVDVILELREGAIHSANNDAC